MKYEFHVGDYVETKDGLVYGQTSNRKGAKGALKQKLLFAKIVFKERRNNAVFYC